MCMWWWEGSSATVAPRHPRVQRRICRLSFIVATALLLGSAPTLWVQADDNPASYRFGPGDKLHITVLNDPDLSGDFTIQQSGEISLPSVGRIEVVGHKLDEFEDEVIRRLRKSGLLNPQITVDVAAYRPIYVVGDVKSPGRYPFEMRMTVLQALAVAGGFLTLDDQTLKLRLDLLEAEDSLDTLEGDYLAAIAKRARLSAERDGAEEIQFPQEVVERQKDPRVVSLIDSENRLFATHRTAIEGEVAILENQSVQLHDEISNLNDQLKAVEKRSQLIETEQRDVEYLFGKGLTAKARVLELQRLQTDVQRDRLGIAAFVARANQEISKVDLSITNLRNERLDRILSDLAAVEQAISQLEVRQRTGKEIVALRQAMSTQPAARLVLAGERFVITRDQGNGPEDMKATDRSYVLPGDVIRVTRFELRQSSSTARADQPTPGSVALGSADSIAPDQ
jgi:protein involved in polysaccharide export with SLBB domain/K+/H+ antiporter YhaU regulatory subunit KhtT